MDNIMDKKYCVPEIKEEREKIKDHIELYMKDKDFIPPLSLKQIQDYSGIIMLQNSISEAYKDYVTILTSNAIWLKTFIRIPYNRRILILPECLRNTAKCTAKTDKLGLLCELCGSCPIGIFIDKAETLGYLTLVAEGSTIVTKLIEKNQIDGILGVSCINALERSFPYTASTAVPAIALPLTENGCSNTSFDSDFLEEILARHETPNWQNPLDLDQLKTTVQNIFKEKKISKYINKKNTRTEQAASRWMAKDGKRWRPFMFISVYKTIMNTHNNISEDIEKIALAIECFHKASLIHDDIEDNDDQRYGDYTLHKKYGIPIALNIGDFLLGEGYRLIANSNFNEFQKSRMFLEVSENHRNLCLGQGEDLEWKKNPVNLSIENVINIFQHKTSPAFEVALVLGAICADENSELCSILKKFSKYLGIAYQIKDDIEDFTDSNGNDLDASRPSLLRALANENNGKDNILETVKNLKLDQQALVMIENFQNKALETISPLTLQPLKSLLFKIVYKVLGLHGAHGRQPKNNISGNNSIVF